MLNFSPAAAASAANPATGPLWIVNFLISYRFPGDYTFLIPKNAVLTGLRIISVWSVPRPDDCGVSETRRRYRQNPAGKCCSKRLRTMCKSTRLHELSSEVVA